MSLAVRPSRTSALGAAWSEDFSRGRLGVRKNQGQIVEAPPNVLGFNGRWVEFPGNAAAYIEYPRQMCDGWPGITIGCRTRNVVFAAQYQAFVCQFGATFEFELDVANTGQIRIYIRFAALGNVVITDPTPIADWGAEHQFVAAWNSTEIIRLFVDGQRVMQSGAAITDRIDNNGQPLRLGVRSNGNYPFEGMMGEPLLMARGISDAEVEQLWRRSLFH